MKILRFTSLAFILLAGTIQAGAIGGFGPNGGGSGGSGIIPSAVCGDASHALAWNGAAYFCQAITGTAAAGGLNGQAQWNNTGALDGFTFSGDLTVNTGTGVATLSVVNANVGTWGDATHCATITLNAKGLATAASQPLCTPAWGSITGTPTTRAGYGITDALTNVLTSGNVFIGSVGNVATSVALSGDCTLAAAGTITCTKTNNVAFAASATTDTTSATNISSGTLGCGRLPALTGDITSSSCATTLATVNVNTGACGDSTHVCQVTLNGKGLATAASAVAISGGGGSNGLAPFYQSGNWYWAIPAPSASAGGAAVNGVIRWEPIYISGTPTISDMGGRIGTAGSTNCQFALYASSGSTGYSTGSALASTNSFANTSAAVTTAAFTVAYAIPSPGWYWAGVNCNDNTVVWMTFGGSSTPGYNGYAMGSTSAGNLSAGINQTSVAYSTTQAFGTWPTMAGSVTHTGGGVTWLPMFKVQ